MESCFWPGSKSIGIPKHRLGIQKFRLFFTWMQEDGQIFVKTTNITFFFFFYIYHSCISKFVLLCKQLSKGLTLAVVMV